MIVPLVSSNSSCYRVVSAYTIVRVECKPLSWNYILNTFEIQILLFLKASWGHICSHVLKQPISAKPYKCWDTKMQDVCKHVFRSQFSIVGLSICLFVKMLLTLLKGEFAYGQYLWAELIIKNPRWYEQHIYETVCHVTNVT